MKKIIFVIFICLAIGAFSQSEKMKFAKLKMGPELKSSKKSTLSDIVAYDPNGFYAVMFERKGFGGLNSFLTIEFYDKNLNKAKSEKIELKQDNKRRDFQGLYEINDKLYLFSSFINQKHKKKYLFMQTVDKEDLIPHNNLEKIGEINYSDFNKMRSGTINFRISRDSSKFLIILKHPSKNDEKQKIEFKVFSNEMNLLWEKMVEMPYEYKLFDTERFRVSNKGNVYLLGMEFKDKRKMRRKGDPNYKYHVISYANEGSKISSYPIENVNKFFTDMQISITDDEKVICGGFYSDVGTFSIKGCYFLTIDNQANKILTESYKEFGLDFITSYMKEKHAKKTKKKADKGKDVELYEYDLDDIIIRDDGGAVLTGEQFYVRVVTTTSTVNGRTTTSTSYHYYYNNIIVININPDGQIEWAKKVPKRQKTVNDGGFFLSYAMAVVNDNLYFVFNDNPKNLYIKDETKIYGYYGQKESVVVLVKMNANGEIEKEAVFRNKEADIIARPKVCMQVSGNEMVIFGQRKKTQRFARLTFK